MKILTAIALTVLTTSAAFAQDTKGGGSGTYDQTHRQVQLRDLDQMTCTYVTANDLMAQYGLTDKVDSILTALFKIHPYAAYQIRREIQIQSWCLTTNLKHINTNDDDSINASNYLPQVQVAIRDIPGKKVYLDEVIFKKMPQDHQAMSLIHEVNHSFLDSGISGRNDKLRAITKAIYQNYTFQDKQAAEQRMANFDMMLQSTSGSTYFKSTGFGALFLKAVRSPDQFTSDDFKTMAGEMGSPELYNRLVNHFGKAKIAAIVLSERIPGFYMRKVPRLGSVLYNEFKNDGDSLFDDVDETKASVQSIANFGDESSPAAREDAVESMNERLGEYRESWTAKVGACVLTKNPSNIRLGSAGLFSSIGYYVNFSAGFSLTRFGKTVYKTSVKNEFQNHSVLIGVAIGDSLKKKAQDVFDVYEGRMKTMASLIKKGACDIDQSTEMKYFY